MCVHYSNNVRQTLGWKWRTSLCLSEENDWFALSIEKMASHGLPRGENGWNTPKLSSVGPTVTRSGGCAFSHPFRAPSRGSQEQWVENGIGVIYRPWAQRENHFVPTLSSPKAALPSWGSVEINDLERERKLRKQSVFPWSALSPEAQLWPGRGLLLQASIPVSSQTQVTDFLIECNSYTIRFTF